MVHMCGCHRAVACMFMIWSLLCCSPGRNEEKTELLSLAKVLTVDTEDQATAEMGLTDIGHFGIDSEGKIFIADPKSKENFIFILNADGSLRSAFGRQGEGPGEIQAPRWLAVSKKDEIFVTDRGKVVVYGSTGQYLKEFRIDEEYQRIIPLKEDRYLAIAVKLNEDLSQSFQVILCSSELEELKILDSSKIESFQKAAKVNVIPTLVVWERSDSHIYTGNTDEYEIRVFDFDGGLLRRIRKDHDAVPLSEDDKERYERRLQNYPPEIRKNFFIPEAFPPFRSLAAWGDRWLFVQTYEEAGAGGSVFDIFDADGDFAGRAELDGYLVKFKGERAYCLKQKESGYRELVVSRMIWN